MNLFSLLPPLVCRARQSPFALTVLNLVLARLIPFNRVHRFRIDALADDLIRTSAPYRRGNQNHLRGIHACAIATVAEFSAGFLLLTTLDPTRYRLIMSRIEVDYLYQAKERIFSESRMDKDRLAQEVLSPLEEEESVLITLDSLVSDASGNLVAKATTTWQIKRWERVRTKL